MWLSSTKTWDSVQKEFGIKAVMMVANVAVEFKADYDEIKIIRSYV